MVQIIITSALLLLTVVIMLIPLNILLEYNKDGGDDALILSVFSYRDLFKYKIPKLLFGEKRELYKIVWKKKAVKKEKSEQEEVDGLSDFKEKFEKIKGLYNKYFDTISTLIGYLKRKGRIKKLNARVLIGTGNAMYNGILAGLLWSVAGVIDSYLHAYTDIKDEKIDIKPDFMGKKIKIDLSCIFKVRLVHIIIIAIILKNRKSKK